jgi:hypothetical protein
MILQVGIRRIGVQGQQRMVTGIQQRIVREVRPRRLGGEVPRVRSTIGALQTDIFLSRMQLSSRTFLSSTTPAAAFFARFPAFPSARENETQRVTTVTETVSKQISLNLEGICLSEDDDDG